MIRGQENGAGSSPPPRRKRWWVALLLSFAFPGLGQVYAGRLLRGCAALLLICVVIIPVGTLIPMLVSWSLPSTVAGYIVGISLILVVPIDAARATRLPVPASS